MKNKNQGYLLTCILFIIGCTDDHMSSSKKQSDSNYPLQSIPYTSVHVNDNFWLPKMETNRTVTIPATFKKCEESGRIENFEIAAGLKDGHFIGGDIAFNDTDPYKIIEGASYSLSIHPDPKLEAYLDNLIDKIAAAQEPDGYLYTIRTIDPDNPGAWGGKERWSSLMVSHELYNAGHLYEAAVAHYLVTGKRNLLDVAIKNADLIAGVFGPDKKNDVPGHQIIEIGLVKLYRVTNDKKYLDLAKFFLDQRGHHENRDIYMWPGTENEGYSQDHKPVIEQDEALGHAVRATYMYSAMADVASLTDDEEYIKAIGLLWDNVVSKKIALTGGVGARHKGEAFGDAYELPNKKSYNETCAAIGNAMWNHRLFLLHGESKYIDVLETTIYNGFLSGVSLSGDKFFYTNPLESDGKWEFNHGAATRAPWFDVSCCPTNVTRFMPSIPGYAYAQSGENIYVNLYMAGVANIKIMGNLTEIRQETTYPWEGKVKLIISPEEEQQMTLNLRIPGWARGKPVPSDLYNFADNQSNEINIQINGKPTQYSTHNGYAVLTRKWQKNDEILIDIPMPVRRVVAHTAIESNKGKIALQRGPLVYCLESMDNDGKVLDLVIPGDAKFEIEYKKDLLGGVVVITGNALRQVKQKNIKTEFHAIPYYAWSNRGVGEMAVWVSNP